eukprot:5137720-Pyramimonas_sp.AAC.1
MWAAVFRRAANIDGGASKSRTNRPKRGVAAQRRRGRGGEATGVIVMCLLSRERLLSPCELRSFRNSLDSKGFAA